jgi:hypothetical protein
MTEALDLKEYRRRNEKFNIAVNHGKKFREKPFSRNFSRKIFSRKDFFVVLASKFCVNFFVKKFSYKEKFFSRNYLNEKFFAKTFHGNFFFFFTKFFSCEFDEKYFRENICAKIISSIFSSEFHEIFFGENIARKFLRKLKIHEISRKNSKN